jgi:hypothetical protein
VASAIDDAHPALTEHGLDEVTAVDRLADQYVGSGGGWRGAETGETAAVGADSSRAGGGERCAAEFGWMILRLARAPDGRGGGGDCN